MAYQKNKPQATDLLSTSQSDIQGNFQAIGDLLDPSYGSVLFPRQVAGSTTAATTVGLVGRASAEIPAETALFFMPQAGATPIDFTTSVKADSGWTRLPSGIIIQWSSGSLGAGDSTTTYAWLKKFPTACLSAFMTINYIPSGDPRDGVVSINLITPTQIRFTRSTSFKGTAVGFYYLGIGH